MTRRQALWSAGALFAVGCSHEERKGKPVNLKTVMPVKNISDAWQRVHAWLGINAPKIMGNLNPPATDLELSATEKGFGQSMPREWHELYRAHNGMNSKANTGSLFFGMQFLPLDAAVREYEKNNVSGTSPVPVRAADTGIRAEDIYNPKWIAFGHDLGETLLRVDMAPSPDGKAGQVIFTDHADDTVILLAGSLTEFMSQFVQDLEGGRYFLNKQALEDGGQFLDCDPEIDVINWAHSERWKHLRQRVKG